MIQKDAADNLRFDYGGYDHITVNPQRRTLEYLLDRMKKKWFGELEGATFHYKNNSDHDHWLDELDELLGDFYEGLFTLKVRDKIVHFAGKYSSLF